MVIKNADQMQVITALGEFMKNDETTLEWTLNEGFETTYYKITRTAKCKSIGYQINGDKESEGGEGGR